MLGSDGAGPYFFEKTLALSAGSPVLEVEQTLTNEGEEVGHCVWGEHISRLGLRSSAPTA